MTSDIVNSDGVHVAVVIDSAIFDLKGRKLYDLRGNRIYRLSGELVGHLNETGGSLRRLDKGDRQSVLATALWKRRRQEPE
ncbi:hypothetical protein [Bradyrhizobium brasilense]|uniref:hypothetical protein n=1 Tax=Bradyrhizobium brasilense TaxID=1419277 RepID=UPI001E2C98EC|nr:hypothetical protein [Bradyrhizobium brasilense]